MKVKNLLAVFLMANMNVFAGNLNLSGNVVSVADKTDRDCVVSGTVKDDKGEVIVCAVIVDKTSKKGVVTDLDGKYSIKVPQGTELQVLYHGYHKYTFVAGNTSKQEKNIVLKFDTNSIPFIIVDGKPYNKSLNDIPPAKIKSMTVVKKSDALKEYIEKYGDKAKDGIIIIELK